uniref:Uncharacterized protein n=1 Tax=viral metagenome TaxID=1070528 RepID=A0A6C0EHG3_9ZZZZ
MKRKSIFVKIIYQLFIDEQNQLFYSINLLLLHSK